MLSTPGIFDGYAFDTIGTNIGIRDLSVRLSTLGRYQNVIWLVDGVGARNTNSGSSVTDAETALRNMNDQRRANTLATYVRQGGRVWLVGSAATTSMVHFNRTNNDGVLPAPATLTFANANGELVSGHFVYDQAHWRSEFKQFPVSGGRYKRYLGRFERSPGIYAGLPVELQPKTGATDPFPPIRAGQSPNNFYQTSFVTEFLSASNPILEDLDPGPLENFESTLDTLYKVTAVALQPDTGRSGLQSVVMTRYHGGDNAEFLVTGVPIWNFRRAQCKALVDFVLQQLWGLAPGAPSALREREAARPAAGPHR
jgi:hypothetical protein